MMFDIKKKEKEIFDELFNPVIKVLNECEQNKRVFTLKDILDEIGQDSYYYRYTIKGILVTLLHEKKIELRGAVNGNQNYVFEVKTKIDINEDKSS